MDGVSREIEQAKREEAERRKQRQQESQRTTGKANLGDHMMRGTAAVSGELYNLTRSLLGYRR